jgi:uncharacterized DUF497 family protein
MPQLRPQGAILGGIRGRASRAARSADELPLTPTRVVDLPPRSKPVAFRSTLSAVEIHESARKHGVVDEDIDHAIDHALAIEDAGEDPDRWLVVGPDRAGNLLEVVVLTTVEDTQLAIHAMALRAKFRRLLEP